MSTRARERQVLDLAAGFCIDPPREIVRRAGHPQPGPPHDSVNGCDDTPVTARSKSSAMT
jgi:hypothetical protein